MKEQHLKLKEIIWEITNQCNNNCSYCGSNDIKKQNPPTDEEIKFICDEICKYPPEQIDISGGDPLIVSEEVHKYITTKFRDSRVVCKILINPKSLISIMRPVDILKLYDWIGLSINNKEELDTFIRYTAQVVPLSKSTIITNFNLNNIWDFDEIFEFVKKNNLIWQIQFTMGTDSAMYTNKSAVDFLVSKLKEANYNKIVYSDNMNSGGCSAGLHSCGITYKGKVIPCLSMRSWKADIPIMGDLIDEDGVIGLRYIWENCFKEYRFCEFKCCKDVCENVLIDKLVNESNPNIYKIMDCIGNGNTYTPSTLPPYNVMAYAVFPSATMVYGVYNNITTTIKDV